MNNPPMFSDVMAGNYFNTQPSLVKGRANQSVLYYKRYLYNKLFSVYKFTLPDEWALNYFRRYLFTFGSVAVVYTNKFGWICQPYSVLKWDLYWQPKTIQVYNNFVTTPVIGAVGVNCGLVRCMDDWYGLDDIVTRYAEKLAQIDKAININLMNCNVSILFEAESKKQADEMKIAYQKATEGEPFVAINKEVLGGKELKPVIPGVVTNYVVDKLQVARRQEINAFLTEIGINNANYDKKERLNSAEVEQNAQEVKAIASVILENLKECFDSINRISGLNLAVELRFDEEVVTDGIGRDDDLGNVSV